MKKKKKRLWAAPEPKADEKALLDHYNQVLATDGDAQAPDGEPEGLTTTDLEAMGKLVKVLRQLKEKGQ